LLASFAFAADVGAGAERDVGAVQADKLRDPQTGLDGQQHQDPVSSTFPPGRIRSGDEGLDLRWSQERHDPPVKPLRWDGQDALDQQRVLGMAQGRIGEQRADRCQSYVAGPDTVVSLLFQVIQERRDHRRVQVIPVELGGRLAALLVDELKEQLQGVAVGLDGARARLALLGEPVGEEGLQRRRDQGHGVAADHADSCRAAARASSSGAADRCQYVEAGSRCPR